MAGSFKARRANRKAQKAVTMFTAAHDSLDRAVGLLDEAAAKHDARVAHHQAQADAARADRDAHARVQSKLAEFIS